MLSANEGHSIYIYEQERPSPSSERRGFLFSTFLMLLCLVAPFIYRPFLRFCAAFQGAAVRPASQGLDSNHFQAPHDIPARLFASVDYNEELSLGELPAYEDISAATGQLLLVVARPLVLPRTMNVDLTVEEPAAPRVITLATGSIQPMLLAEGTYRAFGSMGMGILQVHDINGHPILVDVPSDAQHQVPISSSPSADRWNNSA